MRLPSLRDTLRAASLHIDASALPLTLALTATLIGAIVRLYGLSAQSLWSDELFTAMYAVHYLPHERLLDLLLAEPHPPLFYLAMRLMMKVMALNEVSLRLPGALCSAAAPAVLFALTRRAVGIPAASVACMMLGLSSFSIFYAQEARFYAPLQLLAAASAGLWLIILDSEGIPRRWNIYLLSAVNLLASLTHLFGFLMAGFEWALLFLLRPRLRSNAAIYIAAAASLLPYVGWLAWSYPHFSRLVGYGYWLTHLTLRDLVSPLRALFPQPSILLILLVPLIAAGAAAWRNMAAVFHGKKAILLWGCIVMAMAIPFFAIAASLMVTVIYHNKNLIVLLPFVYITLGVLVVSGAGSEIAASRGLVAVFFILLVSLITFIVSGYPIRGGMSFYSPYKQQVREGVRWIWTHAAPNDVVLVINDDQRDGPYRDLRLYTEYWNDPKRMRQVVRLPESPSAQTVRISDLVAELHRQHRAVFLYDDWMPHFAQSAINAVLAEASCAQVHNFREVWVLAVYPDRSCTLTDLQFPAVEMPAAR
jgi:dolichyl-phosphate-mannose-protein mannosyltransferase